MSSRTPWRCCAPNNCIRALGPRLSNPPFERLHALQVHHQFRAVHDAGSLVKPNPLANPPASTRPPPLTLPLREACDSAPQYYFQLGKAYLRFYKDGLKSVWTNNKLLRDKLQKTPADDRPSVFRPHYVPKTFSRADWVLFWRVKHDMLRLPFFGLMLLVIGEFTALVVIYADGVVPYTCRIPKQIYSGLEKAEQRRKTSFAELDERFPHGVLSPRMTPSIARTHVLRSLHLSGAMWDRLGFTPPGMWQIKGKLRMAFLEGDDKNLIEDGGLIGLEHEELRIACTERGIDTLGKSDTELRGWLGDWLRLTAAEDVEEKRRRMTVLLMTRPEHWPSHRDFAVPDWALTRSLTYLGAVADKFPSSEAFDAINAALNSSDAERKNAIKQGNGVYAFTLKNKSGEQESWHIDLKETGKVGTGTGPSPSVTLQLSDEDFGKLVAGKANAQRLFMGGKLKVKGDVMKATKLDPILKKAQTKAKL
ncbi:Fatty acid-binding protein [Paramyrothecium foliicola]|nr:Fatty acid-binding protein [Paramyrothecium foliicola]